MIWAWYHYYPRYHHQKPTTPPLNPPSFLSRATVIAIQYSQYNWVMWLSPLLIYCLPARLAEIRPRRACLPSLGELFASPSPSQSSLLTPVMLYRYAFKYCDRYIASLFCVAKQRLLSFPLLPITVRYTLRRWYGAYRYS